MSGLILKQRLPDGDHAVPLHIDDLVSDWFHTNRALGGYYTAGGTIYGENVARSELLRLYNTLIGLGIEERAFGQMAWDGVIYRLSLILDGEVREISLDSEYWHNSVQIYYTRSGVVDTDQGTLSYSTHSSQATFVDDGQDFTAYQTDDGDEDAAYRIQVANATGTTSWAYIGEIVSATEIYVYTDSSRNTPGWNDDDSDPRPTLYSYQVIQVSIEGARVASGVAENLESQAIYGEMEYILTLPNAEAATAEALRDRELATYAWPRSRVLGPSS